MKSVARLTGSLLARKGFAAPSQEGVVHTLNHGLPHAVLPSAPTLVTPPSPAAPGPEAAPAAAPEAVGEAVHKEAVSKPVGKTTRKHAARPTPRPAGNPDPGPRVAMTLRLDGERHLKLRVFSAHSNLSSQEILTAALDDYLERHTTEAGLSHCECLHQGVAPGKACR